MDTKLAMPRKAYSIKIDWEVRILLCDKEIPREDHMSNKDVVEIDWKFINFAYVSFVEEVDKNDDIADTAMARAKKQVWAFATVAIERVRSYEWSQWHKMPIKKIIDWMQRFQTDGKTWEWLEWLDKFYKLYIESWWDINNIWPYT